MKKLLLALGLTFLLSGCATGGSLVKKGVDGIAMAGDALTSLLPKDFRGPVDLSRSDAYFEISLKARNVHRNEDGEWSWEWLEYRRKTHIPWFSGAQWTSDVHFSIGEVQ